MRSLVRALFPMFLVSCASLTEGPQALHPRAANGWFHDAIAVYVDDVPSRDETYSDDGVVETTRLQYREGSEQIVFNRATHKVVVERSPGMPEMPEGRIERDVPMGAIVREEEAFLPLARAAIDAVRTTSSPASVTFYTPSTGLVVHGTIAVAEAPGAARRTATIRVGEQTILLDVDLTNGAVETVRIPGSNLLAFQSNWPQAEWMQAWRSTTSNGRTLGNARARFRWLARRNARLLGMIFEPDASTQKPPAVVLIAPPSVTNFSGIAQLLMGRGFATLLYTRYGPPSEWEASLADRAADAAAYVDVLRASGRYSSIGVVGFGDGGIIALSIPPSTRVDALVLLSTPGRPAAVRLHERWHRLHPAADFTALDALIARGRRGEHLALSNDEYDALGGANGPWLSTWLDVDPAALLAKSAIPATVIEGDADDDVSMDADAQRLASARPNVTLVKLHGAQSDFRDAEELKSHEGTYMDGEAGMVSGFSEAVAAGLRRSRR